MGRIRKYTNADGTEREVPVWVSPTDEKTGKAIPLRTNVTERFPRMSRRDRRRLVREGAKLVAKRDRAETSVPKRDEERRIVLTDEL